MKKSWTIIFVTSIIVIGVVTGIFIYNNTNNKKQKNNIVENEANKISGKIVDDCLEEWEELKEQAKKDIEANSLEEKISPNCSLILKRYYRKCEHTLNEYTNISEDLVNKTQKDLEKEYPDWEIKKFSSRKIILYKEYEEECGEHFILRNDNGKITIYKIDENQKEEVYEKTDITVDYLTETDKIEIQNGIRVNGREELNQIIEDFE